PFSPLTRMVSKLCVSTRVHRGLASAVRSQPSSVPVRRVVQEDIELVISAEGQGRAILHHAANEVKRFANCGTAIDVVAEENHAPLRVAIRATMFTIAKACEQVA